VISLKKRKQRLIAEVNLARELFTKFNKFPPSPEATLWSSGVVNHIWQAWCRFWRYYWLVHIQGGRGTSGIFISGSHPGLAEPEAVYQILILAGRKKIGTKGRITSSYQEVTWGDIQKIQDIANSLLPAYPNLVTVQLAATIHGQSIGHLQVVRNCHIHPSQSSRANTHALAAHYLVKSSRFTPSELVLSTEIKSGRMAIVQWVESIIDFAMMV
jgi:hypothetical protein